MKIAAFGCILILLSILLGCATVPPKEVYPGYPAGMEPPEPKIAVLNLGAAYEAIIDDRHYVSGAKYGSVRLLAGVHRIRWAAMFGVSVMVDARGYAPFERISKLAFEGGHVYILRADRTTGHGFRAYLWIEDMTTGEIVDGEKKP